MGPFLVKKLFTAFQFAERVTPFELIASVLSHRRKDRSSPDLKKERGGLTEVWVVGHFVLAGIVCLTVSRNSSSIIRATLATYGAIRVFELVSFQFFTQILGGYPNKAQPRVYYTVLSLRRSIVLAVLLYVEVVSWFASFYRCAAGSFYSARLNLDSGAVAFYYSAVTMTTLGYGDILPKTGLGCTLVVAEVFIGVFMAIMILARVVAYLPSPNTNDLDEQPRKAKTD